MHNVDCVTAPLGRRRLFAATTRPRFAAPAAWHWAHRMRRVLRLPATARDALDSGPGAMNSFRHEPLSAMHAAPSAATATPTTNRPRRDRSERTGVQR